ncbi:glycoside hydrolase family 3 N-terminal domain-containing protein [Hymenobacter psoromatis]|uniref:glycoside hydrolase family 3 N-terminal domain-containing protein n=1 Tax=Hymenobacter psoromatis TaxID=1484116 RepID=UPI001CBD69C4|nr:glycoside hydrolase family 3 N-terminal domain-containing protein [Hymenobacter psoromatis]
MRPTALLLLLTSTSTLLLDVARPSPPLYKNPRAPIADRVRDLLGRMTLEEKVMQMVCINYERKDTLFTKERRLDEGRIRRGYPDGLGQIAVASKIQNVELGAAENARVSNELQRYFVEKTRLGIPVVIHEEGLHGLAGKGSTSFPQPIALAGTFDPALVRQLYAVVGQETRSRGAHQILSPVVDVAREPRWGRCEETFGEDPYLVGEMGVAAVNGLQGDGTYHDKKHVLATLKHFAAHGQPEGGTNTAPVNVSERLLRDVFLYPFQQAVERAHVASVMASYNEIDGVPSHANRWLLTGILRREWGFKGYVVADYFGVKELNWGDGHGHKVAADFADAARQAVNAGVNIELPNPEAYPSLVALVRSKAVLEARIDTLVAKLLEYKFRLGLFEDPYVDAKAAERANGTPAATQLARQAAREAIVLLKNDQQVAPLDLAKYKTIAVIGPNARRTLFGEYSGQQRYFVNVLDGIKQRVGSRAKVLYSEGCKITVSEGWFEDKVVLPTPEADRQSIAEAVKVAQEADIIVLAVGGNEQTSREAWSLTHMGDRADLDLIGRQNELADALAATGKPVVSVVINGAPLAFVNLSQKSTALFECWYLGQETGNAIADVLFGDYSPAGKLSMSIPRSAGQLPVFYNYKLTARRGYAFAEVSPLYPFGFGLSYGQFTFSKPQLTRPEIGPADSTTVSVTVRNASNRPATEIVQLYIRDEVSSVTRPVKELKGFQRVTLQPGKSQVVTLPITPARLGFYDLNYKYTVEPGEFTLMVGNSSRTEDLQTTTLRVRLTDK